MKPINYEQMSFSELAIEGAIAMLAIVAFISLVIFALTGAEDERVSSEHMAETIKQAKRDHKENTAEFDRLSLLGEQYATFQESMK
jgi:hypothetical protein